MVNQISEQQVQGIAFVDEFPEATILTLSFDGTVPSDVQVHLLDDDGEGCGFDISIFLLCRSLFPEGYNLRAFMPFVSDMSEVNEFMPTTEGDFKSGFQHGVLFDFTADGLDYQIWLPREELLDFVRKTPQGALEVRRHERRLHSTSR